MSVSDVQNWNQLNDFFDKQELVQTLDSLPRMVHGSPNLQELAQSTKTLAELHLNRDRDPKLKRSTGYALMSAYCQLELGRFAPATAILDWLKKYDAPKPAITHLAELISKSFSNADLNNSQSFQKFKVKAEKEEIPYPRPNTPLFSKLSSIEALALINQTTTKTLKADEVLFEEGDPAKAFYIVVEGTLELSAKSGFKKSLAEGDFFGEIAVLGNKNRTTSLRAKTESKLLEFSKEKLISSFIQFPALEERLLQFYFLRLFLHLAPQHSLFKSFSEDMLSHFFYLQRAARATPGTLLIQQGVNSSRIFFLLEGQVSVTKDGQKIGELGAGEFIGEMGMLEQRARSAQVAALTICDYLECPDYLFDSLCKQFPSLKPWLETAAEKRVSSSLQIND